MIAKEVRRICSMAPMHYVSITRNMHVICLDVDELTSVLWHLMSVHFIVIKWYFKTETQPQLSTHGIVIFGASFEMLCVCARSQVYVCPVPQCCGDKLAARWQHRIHARCLTSLRWCGEYVLTWPALSQSSSLMKHTYQKCQHAVKHLPSIQLSSQVLFLIILNCLISWCYASSCRNYRQKEFRILRLLQ